MRPDHGGRSWGPEDGHGAPASTGGTLRVLRDLFGTEIADRRALWGFVLRVSILVTVVAEILNLLSLALFPGHWGFERFAIQTFVIAFSTAIPSTWFVGWTAMQLTRAKEDLHVLSRTDGLTGLPNRLSFQEVMERADAGVLAIVDIDHFKTINDTYGHPVGDEVIREVGRRIAAIQPDAFVARIGGEEFACVAGRDDGMLLQARLERIRAEFASRPLQLGGTRVPVTISAGLADRDGRPTTAFYGAADRALYVAKNTGRNRVRWESDAPPAEPTAPTATRPAA